MSALADLNRSHSRVTRIISRSYQLQSVPDHFRSRENRLATLSCDNDSLFVLAENVTVSGSTRRTEQLSSAVTTVAQARVFPPNLSAAALHPVTASGDRSQDAARLGQGPVAARSPRAHQFRTAAPRAAQRSCASAGSESAGRGRRRSFGDSSHIHGPAARQRGEK